MMLCCGEALIDFMPASTADGRAAYRPVVGGSPYNVAIGMGRLGGSVGLFAGISRDLFGQMLANELVRSNVSTDYTLRDDRQTTLAFVSLGEEEPQYAFYDEATSSRLFDPALALPPGPEVTALGFGSVSLIGEPAGGRLEALLHANRGRRVLFLDPNCRPSLVRDRAAYLRRIRDMLAAADIIKISRADLAWLAGEVDERAWAEARLGLGARLVVITQGREGAVGYGRNFVVRQPAIEQPRFVDAVGAGDAFSAGLLFSLQRRGHLDLAGLPALDAAGLGEALAFAAMAASLTCGKLGADPPWRQDMAMEPLGSGRG